MIVSVVAENTSRVIGIEDVSPDMIRQQIDAVFEDIQPDAVKVGMLSQPPCMEAVAEKLRQYRPKHVVIDPVMYAKNGCPTDGSGFGRPADPNRASAGDASDPKHSGGGKNCGLLDPFGCRDGRRCPAHPSYGAEGCVGQGRPCPRAMPLTCCSMGNISIIIPPNAFLRKIRTAPVAPIPPQLRQIWRWGWICRAAVERAKAYVTMAIRHALAIGKGAWANEPFL